MSLMMSGPELEPTFSTENGDEFCTWCQSPITVHTIQLLGTERTFRGKCKCDEAARYWHEVALQDPYSYESFQNMQRQHRIQRLWEDSRLPARWKNRTFEAFEITDKNRDSYQLALEYATNFNPQLGEGLLLVGTVGTGKTHLAAAIAMNLLDREHSVVFGTVTSLLGQIRSAFDSDRISEREVMDKLCRCQLLIIDDLGKEKTTDWVEQTLYEIINTRYEDNKSLVITTNMNLDEIRNKYQNNGDAIVDRILETCEGVEMKWPSWRKRAVM